MDRNVTNKSPKFLYCEIWWYTIENGKKKYTNIYMNGSVLFHVGQFISDWTDKKSGFVQFPGIQM